MIQLRFVRATACTIAIGLGGLALAPTARADEPHRVAVYWQPPGNPPLGAEARTAFSEVARSIGARFVDVTPPATPPPSLVPALEAAKAAYARFDFADTISRLNELARLADGSGGGDLDARALSEIFFYRGLAKLEKAAKEAAWEDLVRAARLDPARVVDPTQFPPRAVTAYKRAVAEVGDLPRVELTLDVPAGATVRLDGTAAASPTTVTPGAHFVAVVAEGHEPWTAVVSVAGPRTRLAPPLRRYQAPQGDALLANIDAGDVRRVLSGALENTASGWQFVARDLSVPDGKVVTESIALGGVPTRAAVQAVVRRLLPPAEERRSRWLPWAIAGGVALLAGAAVTYVMFRDQTSPNVVGGLGSWR